MKKKRLPVIGIVLLIIALVAAGGIWYWNTHKKSIIRAELDKAIKDKSGGLYKIQYDSLELDEVNGSLSVSSFTLVYDSLKYLLLKNEPKEPYLLFNISIPQIRIAGIQTPRALIDKEISGRHVTIMNPVIEILYTGKDSSRSLPDKEIYEQILGNLNLIKFDSVVISGAEIITRDLKSGKTLVRFKNVSLNLLQLAVDSTASTDTTRILFAKDIEVDCEKFTWQSRNNLYNYQVDSLAMRSATSTVSIKNLFMIPNLSENEFVKKVPHQTDRMEIAFHNIQLKSTDFYQLANEVIITDTLSVGSANFKIYRDRNMPEDNTNKLGTYPHQLIQKIPVSFEIKKAIIRSASIEYKEKSSITHQSGKVQFSGTSAYVSNITNRKESISNNNRMVVDMKSSFLNRIPMSAKWVFYLGDKDGKFSISGKTGQADARLFNSLSVPMGPAEFKSGHIKTLDFNLEGTNRKIQGRVNLLYDDFKISLLKKDKDSVHFEKRSAASLLANMKIENSNPEDEDDAPRVANIDVQRDMNRSIFNLAWKSIFEGIQIIVGVKKK